MRNFWKGWRGSQPAMTLQINASTPWMSDFRHFLLKAYHDWTPFLGLSKNPSFQKSIQLHFLVFPKIHLHFLKLQLQFQKMHCSPPQHHCDVIVRRPKLLFYCNMQRPDLCSVLQWSLFTQCLLNVKSVIQSCSSSMRNFWISWGRGAVNPPWHHRPTQIHLEWVILGIFCYGHIMIELHFLFFFIMLPQSSALLAL